MQFFSIQGGWEDFLFKKSKHMFLAWGRRNIFFAACIPFLLSTTNIYASESLPLIRTTSRQPNELLIHVDHQDCDGHYPGLYLIINNGAELGTDRLLELKGLQGLKIEKLGGNIERIPGFYWVGGIGQAPQLSSFNDSLRILDLSLPTTSGTFKLSREGSSFLKDLVNLEELDLSNHYITDGASNLASLVKLRRLDLYNNKIGDSIKDLKTLVNMEVLNLGNNGNMPIELLRETLLAMTKLEEVDLSFFAGVSDDRFNGWFAPQIAAGVRVRLPRLRVLSCICPIFADRAYSLPCDGIISAGDFLRELNHRLRREAYFPSTLLSKSECSEPGGLINVLSYKGDGRARYQKVYDPEHFLMNREVFNPRDPAGKGTRKVGFYSLGGKRVLCLKEAPEAPGMERAARILHETLFGAEDVGVPNSETIIMSGRVFTASSYVDGKCLEDEIDALELQAAKKDEHKPTSSEFIVNLHQMKVFAMLIGPEDGRPQNFLWQEIKGADGENIFRLVSIDHDRCFGDATPHPSRKDPGIIVRGHSVMHCFPESNPNYDDLKRVLFSKAPKHVFEKWLSQVRIENSYQHALAMFAKITGNTRLGVPITETVARNLFEKLGKIYGGLNDRKTLEEIFMVVDAPLAQVYRSLSASTDTLVTPPGFILREDDATPPRSSLARAAKRIRKVDGGRIGKATPPSANCEVYGDYLPSQSISRDIETVMWGAESPRTLIALLVDGAKGSDSEKDAGWVSEEEAAATETAGKRRRLRFEP